MQNLTAARRKTDKTARGRKLEHLKSEKITASQCEWSPFKKSKTAKMRLIEGSSGWFQHQEVPVKTQTVTWIEVMQIAESAELPEWRRKAFIRKTFSLVNIENEKCSLNFYWLVIWVLWNDVIETVSPLKENVLNHKLCTGRLQK